MGDALKPCPFCGSRDTYLGRDPGDNRDHVVWCRSCGAHGGPGYYPELAMEEWNRRAERTCHVVERPEDETFGVTTYLECSECRESLGFVSEYETELPNFCPNCGARVEP